jgi:hypothetical protein
MKSKLFVILALAATSAFAAPKRDDLKYFAGTWKCTGMDFASEMGPEHPNAASVTLKWTLNDQWLDIHYAEMKTAKNAHPFAVNAYWGYDQGSSKLVSGYVDNMGGYGTSQSDGWQGDTLIFAGPMHMGAMTLNSRDVFTKKGANAVLHSAEMQDKSGGWKKMTEETCKR